MLSALAACENPCAEGEDIGRSTLAARTKFTGSEGSIAAEIHWPTRAPEGEAWPVAVIVPGGFAGDSVAVGEVETAIQNDEGVISVHVDTSGPEWADGVDDMRGVRGRKAVALALDYAAGLLADDNTCQVTDRSAAARTDRVVLVGMSNGGNLAAATLADPELGLPPVSGFVAWESPAGAAFVNAEHHNSDVLYTPGSCTVDASGVHCPYAIPELALTRDGNLCFDDDDDAQCRATELVVYGTTDRTSGVHILSPDLTAAAESQGLMPERTAPSVDSATFWQERDAAWVADQIVDRHPDLPVLLVASETDHVLTGLSDHPHVFGLGERLQAAGVAWLRLNPGHDWSGYAEENEPNLPLLVSAASGWLTPESGPPLEENISAAVREITERTDTNLW